MGDVIAYKLTFFFLSTNQNLCVTNDLEFVQNCGNILRKMMCEFG